MKLSHKPHGKHLIAGQWIMGEQTFESSPVDGPGFQFSEGASRDVDLAAIAAEEAFWSFGELSREKRAEFLMTIADEIEQRGTAITEIGSNETGLPAARLDGERGRTTGQLRLFANHILDGAYLDRRYDAALPDRQPLPRPDIRMIQRPVGPVAVFGASNFPLAFSTAGGDTASALAAGCPVVVKGHPAHPGTGELVAEAIHAAIVRCGVHPGVFSFIQGAGHHIGGALVTHPLIKAVGFTGSFNGGRALFDLCTSRTEPIPFYGELGSINPVFVLTAAAKSRGTEIAAAWVTSLAMGVGQFCTNPGLCIINDGPDADAFVRAAKQGLDAVEAQAMLTQGIAHAYCAGRDRIAGTDGVTTLLSSSAAPREATPSLFETDVSTWLKSKELGEEVFGPLGLIIRVADKDEMVEIAKRLEGQLTCTLQLDDNDHMAARNLMPILERKAGRLLANGFPTGVEVCDAMVHGGPYPASTNFGATSVGTLSIRRFLRPVCYQNMPGALLPIDLQKA